MTRADGYGQRVPAADRAARVLRCLAEAPRPQSLAAVARAIEASPSSTLAVLNTLRAAGLVARLEGSGAYLPGAGLVALGEAAAQHWTAVARFSALASDLVERTGETALLWLAEADAWVLAAVLPGSHQLRYVPLPGLRRPRPFTEDALSPTEQPGILEGAGEAGTWQVVAPLPTHDPRPALISLEGLAQRLRGSAGADARRALAAGVDNDGDVVATAPRFELSGPIDAAELAAFLDQGLVATLSYLAQDGYPATVPLWYHWDGAAFWLAPQPGAEWAQHVQRHPRVSLAISESAPPLRRVLARGEVALVPARERSAGWQALERSLARRYADLGAERHLSRLAAQRSDLLRLVPGELIAWRGLLRHPRLGDPDPDPVEQRDQQQQHTA